MRAERQKVEETQLAAAEREWQETGVISDRTPPPPPFSSFDVVFASNKKATAKAGKKSKKQRRLEKEWEIERHKKEELRRLAEEINSGAAASTHTKSTRNREEL